MDSRQPAERFAAMEPKLDASIARICDRPEFATLRAKISSLETEGRTVAAAIAKLQDTKQDQGQAEADARNLLRGLPLEDIATVSVPSLQRKREAIEAALQLVHNEWVSTEQRLIREQSEALEDTANKYIMAMLAGFEAAVEGVRDFESFCAWCGAKKLRLDCRPSHWQLWQWEILFLQQVSAYLQQRREVMKATQERAVEAKAAKGKGIIDRIRNR